MNVSSNCSVTNDLAAILLCLASLVPFASPAHAQRSGAAVLHIRVVEHANGRAIEGAHVALTELVAAGTEPDSARAVTRREGIVNSMGRLTIAGLPFGRYHLEADRIGYVTRADTVSLEARAADAVVEMAPRPVQLGPIAVVGRSQKLSDVGYYERQESGLSGQYLTLADVERYRPRGLTDLFYRIPGTKITYNGPGQRVLRFRRWPNAIGVHPDGCVPDIYLDGALLGGIAGTHRIYAARLSDYDVISPYELEGMEVYVGAATPVRFRNTCGVVLIWTRR